MRGETVVSALKGALLEPMKMQQDLTARNVIGKMNDSSLPHPEAKLGKVFRKSHLFSLNDWKLILLPLTQ